MNWNGTMQIGSALATYVALMGAFLAGYSPLEFALYSAVLLCLWLSFYSIALYSIVSTAPLSNNPAQPKELVIPSLSESMVELHSLQREISTLQAQFYLHTKTRPIAPDDSVD